MPPNDDLRLNELERFRKTSNRLVLEAHSHCEVPAGCGGVVLRWRRPGAPIGMSVLKYVGGTVAEYLLDGKPLDEQRTQVLPGEHVLSFVVDRPASGGFILLKANLDPHVVTARRPVVTSRADGRWQASLTPPSEGWMLPGYVGKGFVDLVEKPVSAPAGNRQWMLDMLKDEAAALGLPDGARPEAPWYLPWRRADVERVWIRWAFRLDEQGFA